MNKVKLTILALIALVGLALVASPGGAQANSIAVGSLADHQQTNWGLSDFGDSRSIGDFSSLGWALEEVDDGVLVGGNFLNVRNNTRTESQPYLAKFNVNTGVWDDSFTPDVESPILAIQNDDDGNTFLGGEIDRYNGNQVGALLKIDPITGEQDFSFQGRVFGGNSVVRDLYISNDNFLYVAGSFDTANDGGNPIAVNNVVRFDLRDGSLDRTWIPDVSSDIRTVWGVATSFVNNNVYIVGVGADGAVGRTANRDLSRGVVAVSKNNANAILWDDFELNKTAVQMYDVETTPNGRVFFAGTEHGLYIHDETDNLRLINNHVTNRDSDNQESQVRTGGDYQDLERVGNVIFATCHCWGSHSSSNTLIDYTPAWDLAQIDATHTGNVSGVIAYNATTGDRIRAFDPYFAGDVGGWATLATTDGCLWITGGFNSVGEPGTQQQAGRDLIRLCPDGGGTPPTVAAPTQCRAVISGNSVQVTWTASADAEDYIVRRTADAGASYWRGRTAATSFTDTGRDAVLAYTVIGVDGDIQSNAANCTTSVEEPPEVATPSNCSYQVSGNNINVSWTNAADATRHAVYRSVDGSQQWWRGVVENGSSFTDTNRDGSIEYFVGAVFADESRSERVSCVEGPAGPPPPQPEPVTPVNACTATLRDNGSILVNHDGAVAGGVEYVIERRVDAGAIWWRGLTDRRNFVDTSRTGTIRYWVTTKVGNDRSVRVRCTPDLNVN